jgi:hypothetical protein
LTKSFLFTQRADQLRAVFVGHWRRNKLPASPGVDDVGIALKKATETLLKAVLGCWATWYLRFTVGLV